MARIARKRRGRRGSVKYGRVGGGEGGREGGVETHCGFICLVLVGLEKEGRRKP